MANLRIEVKGQDEIIRNLGLLTKNVQTKIGRKAVRAGLKPIQKSMKAKAKRIKETGALEKSIITTVVAKKGEVDGRVGAEKNFVLRLSTGEMLRAKAGKEFLAEREKRFIKEKIRRPQNYAHLVEFGTYRSRPKPFMRPAFDAEKITAENEMIKILVEEIEGK